MSECPHYRDVERLVAGHVDEPELERLEQHLNGCPYCRDRLAAATGINALVPGEAGRLRSSSPSSTALKRVMERLQKETPIDTAGAFRAGSQFELSFLQPTEEPGFIGRLGNYQVRRLIGRGGMGIVLEALDPLLKRTVAIKMLSPWKVLDAETKGRFLREAQSAAALAHENVVAIHAVEQVEGTPFLVLEYVAGESLEDRLRRVGKLSFDEVARIGAQVARGLAAAHSRGLIHRDIKPANILLEEETGRAKIADFGLAKVAGEEGLTLDGTVLGTPEFMSPEQATNKQPDERSDLFSLGAVLYFAVTGSSPFRRDSALMTLDNVRRCEPPPLAQVAPELPLWFCDLVHRLLAKVPEDRLGWASAVAETLQRSNHQPTVALPPASRATVKSLRPDGRSQQSHPWWWAAGVASVLLVGLIAAAIVATRDRATDTPPQPIAAQPPGTLPSQPPPSGFAIAGNDEVLENLAAAVDAASDGDVIEVRGNGPFLTPPLTVIGKRLTIRAAANSHPIFMTDDPSGRASQNFLQTDSDVRLEGLEIRWTVPFISGTSDAEMLARCTVRSTNGRLMLANCRVVSPNACVGAGGRDVIVRGCHLVNSNAVGIFWRSQPGGRLHIEECVLENRMAIAVRADRGTPGETRPQIKLARNTIAAEKCLQLIVEGDTPRQSLPIAAEYNVIHSDHLIWLIRQLPPRAKSTPKKSEPGEQLGAWVAWSEQGNVYRRGIKYASRPAPFLEIGYVTAEFSGVDAWLDSRKLPAGRSIEGEIRFQPRPESPPPGPLTLDKVENPSGPLPAETGARPQHVGPGSAYHAWRASPEYANWPDGQ